MKIRNFLLKWWYPEYWWKYLFGWLVVDTLFVIGVAELRIPRLAFGWKAKLTQIILLSTIDIILFKQYDVSSFFLPGPKQWSDCSPKTSISMAWLKSEHIRNHLAWTILTTKHI